MELSPEQLINNPIFQIAFLFSIIALINTVLSKFYGGVVKHLTLPISLLITALLTLNAGNIYNYLETATLENKLNDFWGISFILLILLIATEFIYARYLKKKIINTFTVIMDGREINRNIGIISIIFLNAAFVIGTIYIGGEFYVKAFLLAIHCYIYNKVQRLENSTLEKIKGSEWVHRILAWKEETLYDKLSEDLKHKYNVLRACCHNKVDSKEAKTASYTFGNLVSNNSLPRWLVRKKLISHILKSYKPEFDEYLYLLEEIRDNK